jgi:hypothetical protein
MFTRYNEDTVFERHPKVEFAPRTALMAVLGVVWCRRTCRVLGRVAAAAESEGADSRRQSKRSAGHPQLRNELLDHEEARLLRRAHQRL